nr:putative ribonuclease H-like domain-containing protein [Tanacetum cinerariifolium]GEX86966.1 putative ribonuclease H-like domain-containing protein [Tanacetum cinerariifolium]
MTVRGPRHCEVICDRESRSILREREQDDMTKKKDKGKSPVDYFTGNRDFNANFEDYFDNSSNDVSADGPIVPTVGQNYSNSTNFISVAGPSNTNTSPTHGKSSLQYASQSPDMLESDDIIYFDHENEPKRVHQALKDPSWIKAMQEELLQFKMQKVWILVDLPHGKRAIGTKWVYRNKKDKRVVRIEAIRLFLAYASFMGFMVYQMDVTSAFLYETIEEEVYVCQPLGFEDPDHPDKVYKVVKALYGLHQAPRAWYETLATHLLEKCFYRGHIDQTLFIKKQKEDILVVQIYVDDIIFVKQSNNITRLQALVDKKRVVVTEATIRDALHLDDAEGVDCFPNEEIFTTLARMGYEKPSTKLTFYKAFFLNQWKFLIHTILQLMSAKQTSWNEFSSAMASGVICLSTGHTFNFSKYIFESLVRNVDSSSKFYMYPRFIHLIIQKQLGNLSTHSTKYISPALTQKVFENIRRVGKGCSGVETPLFKGMLVAREPEEQGDAEEQSNNDNAAEEPVTAIDDVEDQTIQSPTLLTPPPQQPQNIPSTSQ